MTVTLVAQVVDQLGHAAWFWTGHLGGRHYTDFDAAPSFSFDSHQPAHIPVRVRHDGPTVGQVIYLEHAIDSDDLTAVAVVDLDPGLVAGLETLYTSAEIDKRSRRGAAEPHSCVLTGLAVVAETAGVAAKRLRAYPGDVRSRYDRGQWPYTAPRILGRAAASCEERGRDGGPLYVHRTRPAETRATSAPPAAWPAGLRDLRMGPIEHRPGGRILSVGGRPVEQRDARPPGPIELRHGGRVLSVR